MHVIAKSNRLQQVNPLKTSPEYSLAGVYGESML